MSNEDDSTKVAYIGMIAFAVIFTLLFSLAKYVFM
jgi:hypothetical protein